MAKIVLDPITRIEGHLRIETRIAQDKVVEAWSMGEMFRGFEALLQGRDPLDAPDHTAKDSQSLRKRSATSPRAARKPRGKQQN